MFGMTPSLPARKAAPLFRQGGVERILELGGGQGRDTLFFAGEGFKVCTLDYSREGVETIARKAGELGLAQSITARVHDIRQPLPFADGAFDACFSHMLYCMALTTAELEFLSQEILRILRPGGLNIYTARHVGDAHYRAGRHRGEEMWEVGGFIVHFFGRDMVQRLARGYELLSVEEFEEGELPRKLFFVAQRKGGAVRDERAGKSAKPDPLPPVDPAAEACEALADRALQFGAETAKVIATATVAVAEWVRWKCLYGCPFYGKDAHHPPCAPDAESTRKVLQEYSRAILLHGATAKTVTEAALRLEGEAYRKGYYKAFAFAALPLGPGDG